MKNTTPITLAVLAALGVGGWLIYRKVNGNVTDTRNTDRTTEDINDPEVQQAMQLYNMLGVTKDTFGSGYSLATFHNIPEEKVLNLMLSVTNWPKLQEKFRGMCNNQYSLTKALSDGLTADEYNAAIQYAAAKKVVTTTDDATIIGTVNGRLNARKVGNNVIVGAYTKTDNAAYVFINEIQDDGTIVTASISQSQSKLL